MRVKLALSHVGNGKIDTLSIPFSFAKKKARNYKTIRVKVWNCLHMRMVLQKAFLIHTENIVWSALWTKSPSQRCWPHATPSCDRVGHLPFAPNQMGAAILGQQAAEGMPGCWAMLMRRARVVAEPTWIRFCQSALPCASIFVPLSVFATDNTKKAKIPLARRDGGKIKQIRRRMGNGNRNIVGAPSYWEPIWAANLDGRVATWMRRTRTLGCRAWLYNGHF